MESGEVRCVVFSAEKWIDVSLAEELRKRLLPGEKVIWRDAFRWKDDAGVLSNHYEQANVASLAAEFDYTVILDAGCAAIIRDPKTSTVPHNASKEGQPRLFAKGVEAIHGAVSSEPPAADIPADWVAFVSMCTEQAGKMISGNELSMRAKSLRDAAASAPKPEGDRPGHREALAIQMLVAAGFVTAAKANEAIQIELGLVAGPLKPVVSRSWWKGVKPETDLAEANDVIGCMLEDWQKVGEALGFKDFADPESIIGLCKELFDESPKPDAAEALALLDGVINKLKFDDEHGLETDLLSLRRILTAGASPEKVVAPPADEFADIREFRRREAEMDRRDAEQLAEKHDEFLRGQFPRDTSARDKAHAAVTDFVLDALNISEGSASKLPAAMVFEFSGFPDNENTRKLMDEVESVADQYRLSMAYAPAPHISGGLQPFPFDGVPRDGSVPVYGGDPEFDALPIGASSVPEAPVPMAAEPVWKRDEEKTMLRILLLSADTTGFHGNDPAVHLAKIAKWTDDECRAVDDWCVAMHLHAGDRGVRVPPKPKVLVPERPAEVADPMAVIRQALEPVSAEEFERMVISIIVAETRYPMHHFTRAAKMITELHARGLAE